MKLIQEAKEFFESYELANVMFDEKSIIVSIFEATSRSVLQVKITEKTGKNFISRSVETNMFCDIKIDRSIVKMNFKYKETKISKEFVDVINSLKKNDYVIKYIGNIAYITIIDPRVEEIVKIFMELEPHCKRYSNQRV